MCIRDSSTTTRTSSGRSRNSRSSSRRRRSRRATKVATVAQIASPPEGGEVPRWSAWGPPPLGLPGGHESGD
eukprot:4304945-Pyramimonas_sp.AAC.1